MHDENPFAPPSPLTDVPSDSPNAMIRFTRSSSYADRLRKYRILLDGEEVSRVSAGESIDIPVESGSHSIVAKVDWCGSRTLGFEVGPGETAHFRCGSNLLGARIFLAAIYLVFQRNDYLTLEQVES